MSEIRCGCEGIWIRPPMGDDPGEYYRTTASIYRGPHEDGLTEHMELEEGVPQHCLKCGAKFTLTDGVVTVGPSVAQLEKELEQESATVVFLSMWIYPSRSDLADKMAAWARAKVAERVKTCERTDTG